MKSKNEQILDDVAVNIPRLKIYCRIYGNPYKIAWLPSKLRENKAMVTKVMASATAWETAIADILLEELEEMEASLGNESGNNA